MKMSPEHFNALKEALAPLVSRLPEIEASYQATGLSPMRMRWDMLHASKFPTGPLYKAGLHDAHVDTALRQIISDAR